MLDWVIIIGRILPLVLASILLLMKPEVSQKRK